EVGRGIGDRRVVVGIGVDDGDVVPRRERDELRYEKALAAHFERMPDQESVDLARQQRKKSAEVFGVELLERSELPEHRPEFFAELAHAGFEEPFDRVACLAKLLGINDRAMAFHRKHEIARRLVAPFGKALRPLAAIERAVDLDRRQPAARIFELFLRRQPWRIEEAPPGLVGPATDADADRAGGIAACIFRHTAPGPTSAACRRPSSPSSSRSPPLRAKAGRWCCTSTAPRRTPSRGPWQPPRRYRAAPRSPRRRIRQTPERRNAACPRRICTSWRRLPSGRADARSAPWRRSPCRTPE